MTQTPIKSQRRQAKVLKMPGMVPYYGPRPAWIDPNLPMWITTEEGQFRSRDGIVVTVPKGYITDFASIPRIVWPISPPHGSLAMASLPHDWGYSHGGKSGLLPKAWWDVLFRDLARITPTVPAWKVPVAYTAVRIGGKGGWHKGWHSFEPGSIPDWSSIGAA